MKLKSLLLCGGVFAVTSTQAALNVTERVSPVPAVAEPVVDGVTEQYLYNVGNGFFLGANDWDTRASYNPAKGYKVKLTVTEEATETTPQTISITDYAEVRIKAWVKTFADGVDGIWVDNNSGANCNSWYMTMGENNHFTIANTAFDGVLLGGFPGDDTRLYLRAADSEKFLSDWYAVSVEEYDAYKAGAEAYVASKSLWSKLVEADAIGMTDLSEYEAVYANMEATVADFEASAKALDKAMIDYKLTLATVENPVQVNSLVVNGTFDKIGDFTGWKGTSFSAGGTTGPCAEHYDKTYDTWQKIDGLANGVYALTVDAFYRAGGAADAYNNYVDGKEKNAYLYATNFNADGVAVDSVSANIVSIFEGIQPNVNDVTNGSTVTVEAGTDAYIVPNSMAAAVDYINAGYYNNNKVLFAVSNGSAKIGVRKDTKVGTDWSIFDNFGLTYYGASAEAYQMWYEDFTKSLPSYDADEMQVTIACVEAYNDAKAEALAATVSTYEEAAEKIAALQVAQDDIAANAEAWNAYQEQLAKAKIVASNADYVGDDKDALADYCDLDADEIIAAKELSTDDLIAETAKLKTMTEDAIQNSIQPGTDMTELLQNTDFSKGKDGWTFKAVSGGNVAANAGAKCAEAWNNADFDIYQIVEGAPVGAYEISVQGFYRRGRGDAAWQYYFDAATGEKKDNVEPAPAYVYLNDAKTPLMSVFEYAVPEEDNYYTASDVFVDQYGNYFPNGMGDAGLAFDHGAYKISAIGLVANKGDQMRIGMKGNTTQEGDSWAIFTRFKLVYKGFDAELLSEPLKTAIADIREKINGELGTDVKAKAEKLAQDGEKAMADADGKEMNTALGAIYAYGDSIDASIALFANLATSLDDLENNVAESEAADDVKTKVAETIDEIRGSMESYTNADAKNAQETLADCRYQLALPAGYENASDADPVDLTGLMQAPSFEKDGQNSIEGWENTTGYNFGNNDTQKAALALEFYEKKFDMYQDITVPNGTYMVSVNAFARATSTGQDYDAFAAGEESVAQLYAKSGETEVVKSIEHLANTYDASSEQLGLGSETSFNVGEDVTYYVPNDMVASVAYFDQGRYLNGVTIKVTDGKLRVGIRQASYESGYWVIMDNFRLMYLGTDSQEEEQGWNAVESVETAAAVKTVEIYTVDGVKQNSLQNGINIVVTTDANGNVTTKAVIK